MVDTGTVGYEYGKDYGRVGLSTQILLFLYPTLTHRILYE